MNEWFVSMDKVRGFKVGVVSVITTQLASELTFRPSELVSVHAEAITPYGVVGWREPELVSVPLDLECT